MPLRLEKLFGLPMGQLKQEGEEEEKEDTKGKTEEEKSNLKSLKDAEE